MIKKTFLLLLAFNLLFATCFAGDWINKPPLGVKIDWSNPITKGLVGCWLFNEGGGDKVYDLSGNENTGILTNMAFPPTTSSGWNPGKDGSAIAFDDSNDYINCGDRESLEFSKAFTIEIQFYPTNASDNTALVDKKYSAGYMLYWYYSALNLYINGATRSIIPAGTIIIDNWNHSVAVWDGSYTYMYHQSKLIDSDSYSTAPTSNTNNFIIGYYFDSTYAYKGYIGYIRIWKDRALTSQEIQELYINPYGMFKKTEIALWNAAIAVPAVERRVFLISQANKQ